MVTNRARQKIIWIATKNSKICSDDWHRWLFDPRSGISGPISRRAIDLTEIRRSSKISLWIWSIISGVVNVLDRPGRGASQVEKSPRLNWVTQFLTVAYDGACSLNLSVRMAWISFGALPCSKKKLYDSSRLDVVEIVFPFSLCNKKSLAIRHMNRTLFPTTLSIPSYDIGKWVGLRTYQHPFVCSTSR